MKRITERNMRNEKKKKVYQRGFVQSRSDGLPLSPANSTHISDSEHGGKHGGQNGAVLISDGEIGENGIPGAAFEHRG